MSRLSELYGPRRLSIDVLLAACKRGIRVCVAGPELDEAGTQGFIDAPREDIETHWGRLQSVRRTAPTLALFVHHAWPMRWLVLGGQLSGVIEPRWLVANGTAIVGWELELTVQRGDALFPGALALLDSLGLEREALAERVV